MLTRCHQIKSNIRPRVDMGHHKIQTHKNILIFQKKHMDTVSSGGIFKRFCFRYNIV